MVSKRTEDTLADHTCVCDCLELEAMLETFDAVRATGRPDSNNQLVVTGNALRITRQVPENRYSRDIYALLMTVRACRLHLK